MASPRNSIFGDFLNFIWVAWKLFRWDASDVVFNLICNVWYFHEFWSGLRYSGVSCIWN